VGIDYISGMACYAVGWSGNHVMLGDMINTGMAVYTKHRRTGLAGSNRLLHGCIAAGMACGAG
jgi:hypothetical protein